LPNLKGRFDGIAVRGPVPAGSLADIVCLAKRATTPGEVNDLLREEADTDRYKNVIRVSDDPLVSSDIVADPHASIIDASLTQVVDGTLVKIMSWYDNEWGYSSQMVRHALSLIASN
jgi:glyceraldehyde 3-phosphate dehydrogenase